jgi:hypothetical protein
MTTRRIRLFVLATALLACAIPARAQTGVITTGPVSTNNSLAWDALANIPLPQDAAALVYFVGIDGTRVTSPLPNVSCVAVASPSMPYGCSAKITAEIVAKLNVMGSHSITLTAVSPTAGESGPSIPFVLKSPPAVPTGVRLSQ